MFGGVASLAAESSLFGGVASLAAKSSMFGQRSRPCCRVFNVWRCNKSCHRVFCIKLFIKLACRCHQLLCCGPVPVFGGVTSGATKSPGLGGVASSASAGAAESPMLGGVAEDAAAGAAAGGGSACPHFAADWCLVNPTRLAATCPHGHATRPTAAAASALTATFLWRRRR